jgi:hypothetical protein
MSGMSLYRRERRGFGEKIRVKWGYPEFRRALYSLWSSLLCGLIVLVSMMAVVWLVFHALYIADHHQISEVNNLIRNSTKWYNEACPMEDEFNQLALWQRSCKIKRETINQLGVQTLKPSITQLTLFQIRHEINRYTFWMPTVVNECILVSADHIVQILLSDRNRWYALMTGLTVFLLYLLYLRIFTLEQWRQLNDVWSAVEQPPLYSTPDEAVATLLIPQRDTLTQRRPYQYDKPKYHSEDG